jgi:hypothetical protein
LAEIRDYQELRSEERGLRSWIETGNEIKDWSLKMRSGTQITDSRQGRRPGPRSEAGALIPKLIMAF